VVQEDPLRALFLETWSELRTILLEAQRAGTLPPSLLRYALFIDAADALAAVEAAAPGLPLSPDGLRQLARSLKPGEGGDPLAYDWAVDPELGRLFGVEEIRRPNRSLRRPRNAAGSISSFRAPTPTKRSAGYRRAKSFPLWQPHRRHAAEKRASEAQRAALPAPYGRIYQHLVPTTALIESCWRQYVVRGGKLTFLRSQSSSVGIMQINQRVWRGFYDLERLRWDTGYNIRAGSQILLRYLKDYAIPTRRKPASGRRSPRRLRRLQRRPRAVGPLRQIAAASARSARGREAVDAVPGHRRRRTGGSRQLRRDYTRKIFSRSRAVTRRAFAIRSVLARRGRAQVRPQRMAQRAPRQQGSHLRLFEARFREHTHLSALHRRDRQPVLQQDAAAVDRGHARFGREDADQIQRVGRAQHHQLAGLLALAHRAQPPDRVGGGELLAAEAGDEAPAADLAARFQPSVDPDELAPWREVRLSFDQGTKNDAVALQQRPSDRFHVIVVHRLEQRPAPRGFDQVPALLLRRKQARSPAKLSAVAMPAPASSASPRSTKLGNRFVALANSWKNDAPRFSSASRTAFASDESSIAGSLSTPHWLRCSRGISAIGELRSGAFEPGVSRPQATRPLRQRRSSCSGS
jgi:hypothetical protein